jgi:hypothetical protein
MVQEWQWIRGRKIKPTFTKPIKPHCMPIGTARFRICMLFAGQMIQCASDWRMSNQHDGARQPPSGLPSPELKQRPELVPAALDGVLEAAGIDRSDPQVTKALEISMSFMVARGSLPLPPAEILAEYEKEFPASAQNWLAGQNNSGSIASH